MKARVVKGWDENTNEIGFMIQIKMPDKRNYDVALAEKGKPFWTLKEIEADKRCQEFNLKHDTH